MYTVSNRSTVSSAFYTQLLEIWDSASMIQFIESFLSLSVLHQSINQLVRVLNIPHMLPVLALMLPPPLCGCCCCCCAFAVAILLASLLALFSLHVVMVVLALGVIATYLLLLLLLLLVLPQLPELSSRLTFARICKSNEIIYFVCAYICTTVCVWQAGGKRERERESAPAYKVWQNMCKAYYK